MYPPLELLTAHQYIKSNYDLPEIELAVILGSAQSNCIEFDDDPIAIAYSEVPDFPQKEGQKASGHAKRFLIGTVEGVGTIVMDGRLHGYEDFDGHDLIMCNIQPWQAEAIKSKVLKGIRDAYESPDTESQEKG